MTSSNETEIVEFKARMMEEFEISDLGVLSYLLGIQFVETRNGIFMNQKKYTTDSLKRFNMLECNAMNVTVEISLKLERGG